ncbi:MAG: hypothetical protein A2428_01895 [Bdellovibrionales bacterium RIFOXYC1_FULL_54_43]|nr:MAG: hypothetical protein A2428_01895 [Bdellovibrionales bacterium RIFOXYC1_FULL_54_43]
MIWIGSKIYFDDYFENPYKYVAKTASLSATILICWTILLSTRAKWIEQLFGSLDHVYRSHCRMGSLAFFLILVHPVFLALDRLPDIRSFFRYFWFSDKPAENSGIVALIVFLVLIVLSRWLKIAYHHWKRSHEFFGLFLLAVATHVYLVEADVAKYPVVMGWIYGWIALGLFGFIYIRILYRFVGPRFNYEIERIVKLGKVWEIYLAPLAEFLCYQPGQYLYVAFMNSALRREAHPFSISSARQEKLLRISIKELGDYTSRIGMLKKGDRARISGPYGRFGEPYLRHSDATAVLIAGGIGITPFLSMLEDEGLQQRRRGHTYLYYSVQDVNHAYYHPEIQKLAERNKKFDYIPYFSNEKGFLTVDKIESHLGTLKSTQYFICGPKQMMDALISQLRKKKVASQDIFFEDFNYLD